MEKIRCAIALACVFWAGCGKPESVEKEETEKAGPAEHEHPTAGPNGGELIELGDEEYHAELLHDESSGDVTIFILDASAKNYVLLEAAELTINLKHDGQAEQHKLQAIPQEGEPAGKSSRFVAKGNRELSEAIEHEDANARLQVTIADKAYSGKIEHGHEDHDHDHDHGSSK